MANDKDDPSGCEILLTLLVSAAILAVVIGWWWYAAGVQAAVYERQGVHMTQWEVFTGSKPVERIIGNKP